MDAPQIVTIVLLAMGLSLAMIKHGESQPPYSFWVTLVADVLTVLLLYWGGFWS